MIDRISVLVGGFIMHTHLLRGELRVLTMLNRRAATMKNNVAGGKPGGVVGGRMFKDCK